MDEPSAADAHHPTTSVGFQITVDSLDPVAQARFWAPLLGYQLQPPPAGFASWNAYWRDVGVPEDELGEVDEPESIVDPAGHGPRIWFQPVPEHKVVKNRLHLDVDVSEGRSVPIATRREQVERGVEGLVVKGASVVRRTDDSEADHYYVVMQDPEGNEFCVR
jgi:hypothetical protein